MLVAQNNRSSSPPATTDNNNNTNGTTTITPAVSSSSSNQSLSPPLKPQQQISPPQPTQDYISAYRSSQVTLEYERSTSNTPLYDEQQDDYLTPIDSANCSILSVLAEAFVHQLGHQEVFTGEEAVVSVIQIQKGTRIIRVYACRGRECECECESLCVLYSNLLFLILLTVPFFF